MTRKEFVVDCCFGMPGLNMQGERLKQADSGEFLDARNERLYQVWARGAMHQKVEVKRELERRSKNDNLTPDQRAYAAQLLAELQALGVAA